MYISCDLRAIVCETAGVCVMVEVEGTDIRFRLNCTAQITLDTRPAPTRASQGVCLQPQQYSTIKALSQAQALLFIAVDYNFATQGTGASREVIAVAICVK